MKISDYIKQVKLHKHCKEGMDKLDSCLCPQDVLRLACSPDGREYLMKSVRDGWGASADDLHKAFPGFVNTGFRLERDNGTEDVSLWTSKENETIVASGKGRHVLLLFGFEGTIKLNNSAMTIIYMCDGAKISIIGDGKESGGVYIRNFGGEILSVTDAIIRVADKTKKES